MTDNNTVMDYDSVQEGDSTGKNLIILFFILCFIAGVGFALYKSSDIKKFFQEKWVSNQIEKVDKIINPQVKVEPENLKNELENYMEYVPVRFNDATTGEIYYESFPHERLDDVKLSLIRNEIRKIAAGYTIEQSYSEKRAEMIHEMEKAIKFYSSPNLKSIEWKFKYPSYVMEAIMQKRFALENIEKHKMQLEVAKMQAERNIVEAEARAKKQEIEHKIKMQKLQQEREQELYKAETEKAKMKILNSIK